MSEVGISWGRWPRYFHATSAINDRFQALPAASSMLPFGKGRSYGDVCLNKNGLLLTTARLDRFISFDPATGVVECEAGASLNQLIELVLPHGWFPPVTPGTCYATLGGAIANDVHGKNHHRIGSFCNHVLEFDLVRSDGHNLRCTPTNNPEWFSATAGGLGLTGLIRRVKLQLRRVPGPWLQGDSQRFSSLRNFFALADNSDSVYEYTVAWLDCAAGGAKLGRGVFMRGNHVECDQAPVHSKALMRFPFSPPFSLVNKLSIAMFNKFYFHRRAASQRNALWHFRPFFYPLDRILNWNQMYGPDGFFQYQCVIPRNVAEESLQDMLRRIGRSGLGSFLVVLKIFGPVPSLGLMSFPRPGVTLALDFPNRGAPTLSLLEELDAITRAAGGAVYPAKDARMSAASFQQYFPNWRRFQAFVDPKFSSSFWRRVSGADA